MIFTNSISFVEEIEKIRREKNTDYIDSIVLLCEEKDIEYEMVAYWIKRDPALKLKIQAEAENLNILKRGSRLPID